MVASDTVVGLVGAGILLIALVGVFVVESGGGPREEDLQPAALDASSSGSYEATAGTGTQLPGGVCAPDPTTMSADCIPAQVILDLRLSGLPVLGDGIHYVAFLTGGGQSPMALGELASQGDDHVLNAQQNCQCQDYTTLLVTLELATSPATPTDLVVYEKSVSGGSADLSGSFAGQVGMGNATARFNQAGGGVQVSSTIENVQNRSGFQYRAWFRMDEGDNQTFAFVGNYTFSEDGTEATLQGTAAGVTLADQNRFVVTIAAEGSPTTGERPPGFPYFWVLFDAGA